MILNSLKLEFTDGPEPPDIGVGNQIPMVCKSSTNSLSGDPSVYSLNFITYK